MSYKAITVKEAEQIEQKLSRLGYDFLALHAISRQNWEGTDGEYALLATETISKAAVRTIDAVIRKLGGTPLGNFDCEFEDDGPEGTEIAE